MPVEKRSTTASRPGDVLVFDVLGSLLDEDGGQQRAVAAALDLPAERAERFTERWSARFAELLESIQSGGEPYRISEALYLQAAVETADEQRVPLSDDTARRLSRFGRRLDPFPDVPDALAELAERHPLVALTNAGLAQAFAMSQHAGLRWSFLVSGEMAQAFKPDPRAYQFAIKALELDPERCVFVAAHPWDLEAAAQHGFRTAYLDRAAAGTGEPFTYQVPDLTALSPRLASPATQRP